MTVLKRAFPEGATRADLASFLRGGFQRLNSLPPYSTVGTSRHNPIPLGEQARIGDWILRITSVTPDATDLVLREARVNEPPEIGYQYFLVTLEAEYVGEGSVRFYDTSIYRSFNAVGDRGVAYGSPRNRPAYCGLLPDGIYYKSEVFSGGIMEGTTCFSIQSTDAYSMVMFVDSPDNNRYFLSMVPQE